MGFFFGDSNKIPVRQLTQKQYYYLRSCYEGLFQIKLIEEKINENVKSPELSLKYNPEFNILLFCVITLLIAVVPAVFKCLNKQHIDSTYAPALFFVVILIKRNISIFARNIEYYLARMWRHRLYRYLTNEPRKNRDRLVSCLIFLS